MTRRSRRADSSLETGFSFMHAEGGGQGQHEAVWQTPAAAAGSGGDATEKRGEKEEEKEEEEEEEEREGKRRDEGESYSLHTGSPTPRVAIRFRYLAPGPPIHSRGIAPSTPRDSLLVCELLGGLSVRRLQFVFSKAAAAEVA